MKRWLLRVWPSPWLTFGLFWGWLLRSGMLELIGLFENGQLLAPPVTEYPLADAAKAQADIESGKTVGKLVLIP